MPGDARRGAAGVIDAEAARLDRLVSGLLDLSRIAAGGLHPDLEPHELWSVVQPALERVRPSLGGRSVQIDAPDTLPPVLADAVLSEVISILPALAEDDVHHAQREGGVGADDEQGRVDDAHPLRASSPA